MKSIQLVGPVSTAFQSSHTLHDIIPYMRYVIPSFCASDQLTPNQVISLEYAVAFYPLLLIITTYVCVELHARDFRLIVWLWRPFSRCLAFVLRRREIRFSFVHAFSSFLLLHDIIPYINYVVSCCQFA